ncbi:LamG domain-containing protein [Ralstonia mannitolilytica]|uniref:LamG domain-containing protein n=1 Tax=Ralstonia mannitolilytica TaxID=105219 RepID=UPI0028F62833|nr:LamG domain-containing protein [Ralstonia mannitolilytica]CAJ0858336.1 hypothetical protein R76727_01247 [Ralstonia mannitolilytica]
MALLPLGNVVLLLHCDDASASRTLNDSTPYAQTAKCYGTCAPSTTQSKFGGSAAKTGNGNGNYFAVGANQSLDFGVDDFTIETWLYPVSQGADGGAILGRWDGTHNDFLLVRNADGSMGVYLNGALLITTTASDLPSSTWTHVALVRAGGTVTAYIGGVNKGSAAFANAINWTHGVPLYFGQGNQAGGATWLEAYYDEVRVTNGKAQYTGPFTPPTQDFSGGGDPVISKVVLLMHMDGADGSTTFTDVMGKVAAAQGDPRISTAQSKFGGASCLLSGAVNSYVSVADSPDFNLVNDDFTVECWAYPLEWRGWLLCKDGQGNVSYPQWAILCRTDGTFQLTLGDGQGVSSVQDIRTAAGVVKLNTWNHLAAVRSGTTVRLFVNGVLSQTTTQTATMRARNLPLLIGGQMNQGASQDWFRGYIDDIRVTKGFARYTESFTPPATPFPDNGGSFTTDPNFANVSLLLHCDGMNGSTAFPDNSSQALNIAAAGTAAVSTTQSMFGGASLALSGSSALYGTTYTAALRINAPSTSFTVECWAYLNSTSGDPYLVSGNDSGNSQRWAMQVYGGRLAFYSGTGAPTRGSTAIPTGSWVHLAVCYDATAGIFKTFVNGVQDLSNTMSMPTGTLAARVEIGAAYFNSSNYVNGYLDDIRITKGVARYAGTFTPPTAPFPDSGPPPQVLRTLLKPAYLRPRFFLPTPAKAQIRLYKPSYPRVRDQLFGGMGKVAGTVEVAPSTPVSRKLWLLDERCLLPIRSTWSDPVTGAYQFSYVDTSRTYTVVGYDHTKTYRAVIAHGVIPDPM